MKKIFALFLVLIMLFSLCACNSVEKKAVGIWLSPNGTMYLDLMKDGTGMSYRYGPVIWDVYGDYVFVTYLQSGKTTEYLYDSENDTLGGCPRGK